MNAKEYVEKFCNKKYDETFRNFTWVNFNKKKYYIPSFLTDYSQLLLSKSNNFLKIPYPNLYGFYGFKPIIDEIIYNKILER